jgi:hypothetical protein
MDVYLHVLIYLHDINYNNFASCNFLHVLVAVDANKAHGTAAIIVRRLTPSVRSMDVSIAELLAAVDRDRPWQLVQNLSTLFVLATAAD